MLLRDRCLIAARFALRLSASTVRRPQESQGTLAFVYVCERIILLCGQLARQGRAAELHGVWLLAMSIGFPLDHSAIADNVERRYGMLTRVRYLELAAAFVDRCGDRFGASSGPQ